MLVASKTVAVLRSSPCGPACYVRYSVGPSYPLFVVPLLFAGPLAESRARTYFLVVPQGIPPMPAYTVPQPYLELYQRPRTLRRGLLLVR
jgi:hypothetical protein